MFKKLRNRIIITTMAITTTVLVLAGVFIVVFSSATRPEPKPRIEVNYNLPDYSISYNEIELKNYIESDRQEGHTRLLITLLSVGTTIEIAVFIIIYHLSRAIVEPVKDSYEKQKIFIANASHELKTPLAVIEANIEALDVDKSNQKWKDNIESEITHANKLVLDLLQLARMDTGSLKQTPPENIDLTAEIKNHITLFEPKFAGKITFNSNNATPHYLLPKQDILQILDILLDNATKYGRQKISLTLDKSSLTVQNDGTTIAKDDLAKVFDRFYQTDKTKSGSGLGLAIAKAICDQNHWKIHCESTHRTTKFTVSW